MSNSYSQSKALFAITKASFRAIFSNPSALIFSLIFPIVFVMIFGAFGNGGGVQYHIALDPASDTTNAFFQGLKAAPAIKIEHHDQTEIKKELQKGKLTAVLLITEDSLTHQISVKVNSTTASSNTINSFMPVLDYIRLRIENAFQPGASQLIKIDKPVITEVRKYLPIDFILPGQLGFSILFSTLFGIAFSFFGLREQLVLKRFYATPIKRINILLGIGMSRLSFQLFSVITLVLFGHLVLDFTLQNGAITFFEIIGMTLYMLFLLMGVGLIFSSIVKTDSTIPLLINLFAFPQMLLSGTFFSIDVFPSWLQVFCRILPLTQFNDAIRKISFEGLSLFECWKEIGILGVWMAVIYIIAARVLKWE
jgi:ABC-2 type transport system permease protein